MRWTAADYVNELSEKDLADLDLSVWRRKEVAKNLQSNRSRTAYSDHRPIGSGRGRSCAANGENSSGNPDFYGVAVESESMSSKSWTRCFEWCLSVLKAGGRFVVLTFMSTEDRKVKQAFQGEAREGRAMILTKHVVKPSDQEVFENAASRSSKLRALERV